MLTKECGVPFRFKGVSILLFLLHVINAVSSVEYEEEMVTHSLIEICGVPLGFRVYDLCVSILFICVSFASSIFV
jgi:hypothetical protein